MMEFKFRAWVELDNGCSEDDPAHYTEKLMFDVAFLAFDESELIEIIINDDYFHNGDSRYLDPEEVELMQFTGLQDKCGVPIYEGDIVREKSSNKLLQIVWIKHLAMFLCKPIEAPEEWEPMNYDECISDLSFGNCIPNEYLTVVGNVFENQELLQEGI